MNPNLRDVVFNATSDTPIRIIQIIESLGSVEQGVRSEPDLPIARIAVGVSEVEVYLDTEMIAFLEKRAENPEDLQSLNANDPDANA